MGRTFTKRDIAKQVAGQMNQPVAVALRWVDHVFTSLRETMMRDEENLRIEVRDFGVFEVKQTKSKPKARNPKTGETIYVPPHRKSHFKPGKLLKEYFSRPLNGSQNLRTKK